MDFIDAEVLAGLMEQVRAEAQAIEDAARRLAEQTALTVEEAMTAILNRLCPYAGPARARRTLNGMDLAAVREQKGAREKRRAVERATVSRFRQYKAGETAWTTQKRTGPRRREWRGPWKEN